MLSNQLFQPAIHFTVLCINNISPPSKLAAIKLKEFLTVSKWFKENKFKENKFILQRQFVSSKSRLTLNVYSKYSKTKHNFSFNYCLFSSMESTHHLSSIL